MFKTTITASIIATSATVAVADLATDYNTCIVVGISAGEERREMLRTERVNPEYAEASSAYNDVAMDYSDIAKVYDAEAYSAAVNDTEAYDKAVADLKIAKIKGEMTPAAYTEILNNCTALFTAYTAEIIENME